MRLYEEVSELVRSKAITGEYKDEDGIIDCAVTFLHYETGLLRTDYHGYALRKSEIDV